MFKGKDAFNKRQSKDKIKRIAFEETRSQEGSAFHPISDFGDKLCAMNVELIRKTYLHDIGYFIYKL